MSESATGRAPWYVPWLFLAAGMLLFAFRPAEVVQLLGAVSTLLMVILACYAVGRYREELRAILRAAAEHGVRLQVPFMGELQLLRGSFGAKLDQIREPSSADDSADLARGRLAGQPDKGGLADDADVAADAE